VDVLLLHFVAAIDLELRTVRVMPVLVEDDAGVLAAWDIGVEAGQRGLAERIGFVLRSVATKLMYPLGSHVEDVGGCPVRCLYVPNEVSLGRD